MKADIFGNAYYLTDGGLETTLIFHDGIDLQHFAAFELVNTPEGRGALERYYSAYIEVARKHKLGFLFETPTWRASADWGSLLAYTAEDLDRINRQSVQLIRNVCKQSGVRDAIISGNIGPRGDGYIVENRMSADEAMRYHQAQIDSFAGEHVDIVSALTINYSDEGIGIVRAADAAGVPVVISVTVETDGRLPSGETIAEAIETIDAATEGYALHFMINCAHPEHFRDALQTDAAWLRRIRGIRANASTKSHAELNDSTELDAGNKEQLAAGYAELRELLPDLRIVGGCCGTDHTHMEAVCDALFLPVR